MRRRIANFLVRVWATLSRVVQGTIHLLLAFINQVLGTLPSLIRANTYLSRRIRRDTTVEPEPADPRLQLPEERLRSHYESEMERLERIEEKARATVLGVTLAVSFALPSIGLLLQKGALAAEPFGSKLALALLLGFAVLFLTISGYLALLAYKVGEINKPALGDLVGDEGGVQIRRALVMAIERNEPRILQKANYMSASLDCLRNGLTLVLLFLVAALVSVF